MQLQRVLLYAFIVFLCSSWLTLLAAYGQETEGDEDAVELLPPNYVNETYGFGMVVPEGYITFDYDQDGIWVLQLIGEPDQPGARISAEELPEGVIDTAGYWQLMKDRDPLMENNITYEMVDSIAGTGAILSRVEQIQNDKYILAITWVFVHDGYGFTLSGYPGEAEGAGDAKAFALETAQQFRWMTPEEIAETEIENPPEQVGGGQ
jgi:hypothetical protein